MLNNRQIFEFFGQRIQKMRWNNSPFAKNQACNKNKKVSLKMIRDKNCLMPRSNGIKRCAIETVILVLSFSAAPLFAGYGDQINGYPNQQERELHLATNVVRTAPQEFRDTYIGSYNILLPQSYPSVNPIYLNYDLNRAGRVHAEDIAANCGLSHDSCDGTVWSTRIRSYYTDSSWIAENIATGHPTGFATVIQFLRDDVGGTPAADNSGSDGHRKNIMNGGYGDFGPGYSYSSTRTWYHFWVQDFGGGSPPYYAIASGSHLYLAAQVITFMAVFYDPDGNAPQSAQVVINGVARNMSLHLGSPSRGSYLLNLPDNNDCRDYYFQFLDADGTSWRFPQTTELSNNPGHNCYTPATLADAVSALQVVSNSLSNPGDASGMIDQDADGKIGLTDAIITLKTLAGN
jgi:uncharacterized protein YkwD